MVALAVLASTAIGPVGADPATAADGSAFVAYAVRRSAPRQQARDLDGFARVSKTMGSAAITDVAAAPGIPAALDVVTGSVRRGQTVTQVLAENGVPKEQIRQIAKVIRTTFDLKNAKPGDSFLLTRNEEGELISFQLLHGRSDVFQVARSEQGGLRVAHSQAPVERRIARIGGVVQKSLTKALLDQGERSELVDRFADIFIWQIDFSQESQPGDEYRLVFEKYYDVQGFVRYGKILAAEYVTPEIGLTAIYYEGQNGRADYFTPSGRSLRRSFLRAPVRFTRISSGFSKLRLHPLLNKPMPHEAIDYAAPVGTPIWAVADGKVSIKGWRGGLGRSVAIEHGNGCVSYYGHLSRYGDVEVGSYVRQKRVVGYVGKSGLATGPHLDFRLRCAGKLVDPNRWNARPDDGSPVRMEELLAFEKLKRTRISELRTGDARPMLEAGM